MSERIGHGDGTELANIGEECTLCGADVISMIANEDFVSQTTRPIFRAQVCEVFPLRLRCASFSVTIEVSGCLFGIVGVAGGGVARTALREHHPAQ
jgi:hypothetical protein